MTGNNSSGNKKSNGLFGDSFGRGPRGKGKPRGRRPRINIPINEHIRARTLRVIDAEGNNLGEISKEEALEKAQEAGLDLFVVSDKGDVPIARIVDYGKYKFEQSKKEKSQKKKQSGDHKEIKMRYNIDIGDYNTRLKHSKKFLEQGKKVKLNITLRGREMQHVDLAKNLAQRFVKDLMHEGHADSAIPNKMQGRSLILFVSPGADKALIKKTEEQEKQKDDAENSSQL